MEARSQTLPAERVTPGEGSSAAPPADDAAKTTRRLPPTWVLVVGAIVLIAALIWGIRFLAYAISHETTDDARVDADTVTVTSKINEKVDAILVDTNQPVKKGQVILRLDSMDEQNAVAQAQAALGAQLAQARAAQENVNLTRTQVAAQTTQGTGGVTAAQNGVANAQAQTQSAEQRRKPHGRRSVRPPRSCASRNRRCRRRAQRWIAPMPT